MFPGMDMFATEPAQLDAETRSRLSTVLDQRAEMLAAQAELLRLRARQYRGEDVGDLIDLKSQEVIKLRHDLMTDSSNLLRDSVDLQKLVGLLPLVIGGVLQSFKIPPAVLAEVVGLDLDQAKLVFGKLRDVVTNGIDFELKLGDDE